MALGFSGRRVRLIAMGSAKSSSGLLGSLEAKLVGMGQVRITGSEASTNCWLP